jgi:hypothetical protein
MRLRDEYFVLTRDLETGKISKWTRLPVPQLEFYDERVIASMAGSKPFSEKGHAPGRDCAGDCLGA